MTSKQPLPLQKVTTLRSHRPPPPPPDPQGRGDHASLTQAGTACSLALTSNPGVTCQPRAWCHVGRSTTGVGRRKGGGRRPCLREKKALTRQKPPAQPPSLRCPRVGACSFLTRRLCSGPSVTQHLHCDRLGDGFSPTGPKRVQPLTPHAHPAGT